MTSPFANLIKEHLGGGKPPVVVLNKDLDVVDDIKDTLRENLSKASYKYTPKSIHASQVYKECPRKWWLLHKEGKKHESSSVGCGLSVCFDIGHALHKMVQEDYFSGPPSKYTLQGAWQCMKCLTVTPNKANTFSSCPTISSCCGGLSTFEEPFMENHIAGGELPLVGRCDGVIAVDEKPWAILEVKTANEWSYKQDPEDWGWWPSYLWQAHAYMKGFGLDKTLFMIVNKSKQGGNILPIKFKLVNFDKKIWDQVKSRVVSLNEIQKGKWDSMKMSAVPKLCTAGNIDKNCPVVLSCSSTLM